MSDNIKLNYDPSVTIAVANNRGSKSWKNIQLKLSRLYEMFSQCVRTDETQAEFFRLKGGNKADKERATELKDCGGYVAGELDGTGRRQGENVRSRTLYTADIDSGVKPFGLGGGVSFCRYTTHSHSASFPRFRIVAPLSRPVTPAEYERLSRLYAWEIADMLGMDPESIFTDDTMHNPEHMMFWPSASKDGPFDFYYQDGGPLDVDAILDTDREGFYLKQKRPSAQGAERAAGEKVPEGQRYNYLISKLGTLVNKLHSVCTDDAILAAFWRLAHDDCDGEIDGEDFDAFCSKYRSAVETFRAGTEEEHFDYPAAVGKYFAANPGSELPKGPDGKTDWKRVREFAESTSVTVASRQQDAPVYPEGIRVNKQGVPLKTLSNTMLLLEQISGLHFAFNELSMTEEITDEPAQWTRYEKAVTDYDYLMLKAQLEQIDYSVSTDRIAEAVTMLTRKHPYHPIKQILEGLQWDGCDRFGDLFPIFLGAERSEYEKAVEKLIIMGAISRIYRPGCKFDYMPLLFDRQQGTGKSTIVRLLSLRDEFFTDSVRDLESVKALEALAGKWIAEIGEMLDGVRVGTVESLKAFLSRQSDTFRPAYGRKPITFYRQNIFIGTTNRYDSLPPDTTGNRRFLPINCDIMKAQLPLLRNIKLAQDTIQQMYAQGMEIYKTGDFSLTLPRELEEEANRIREDATPDDPNYGRIVKYLNDTKMTEICAAWVFYYTLGNKDDKQMKRTDSRYIGALLDKIPGWHRLDHPIRFAHFGIQRAWVKDDSFTPDNEGGKIFGQNLP